MMKPHTFSLIQRGAALAAAYLLQFEARGDLISDWSKVAYDYINQYAPNSVHTLRGLAMVHVAQFDAVNAVVGGYSPYASDVTAPTASPVAAAAQAAYSVLTNLSRSDLGTLNGALTRSLAAVPNGPSKEQGILLGRSVANAIIQLRRGDNPDLVVPAVTSAAPGRWRTTPPDFTPGYNTQARYQTPWTMRSSAQFRPAPPPALTDSVYTTDFRELQRVGSVQSATRLKDQTEAAIFMAAGTDIHIALMADLAARHPLPLIESARLFALAFMVVHDGQIQVFDTKYTYNFWRPITAIRSGATDGNPETEADPSWSPLLDTPPHPDYPAAHSEESAALLEVLTSIHGDATTITLASYAGAPSRSFTSFSDILAEINSSRVWAGAHFRHSCEVGAEVGKRIARNAIQNFLRPVPRLVAQGAVNPGEFQLNFTTGPSLNYVVETSSDFVQWNPAQTNWYGLLRYTDPNAGGVANRFYRVVVR